MKDIEEITQELLKFRNERDWEQFHNSKDLALAISIEAAELNELFLWKKSGITSSSKERLWQYVFRIILWEHNFTRKRIQSVLLPI